MNSIAVAPSNATTTIGGTLQFAAIIQGTVTDRTFIRVPVVDGHSDTELRLRFHRHLQGACERARLGRAYAVIG